MCGGHFQEAGLFGSLEPQRKVQTCHQHVGGGGGLKCKDEDVAPARRAQGGEAEQHNTESGQLRIEGSDRAGGQQQHRGGATDRNMTPSPRGHQ